MEKQRKSVFWDEFYPTIHRLIGAEEYDDAVAKLREVQKIYPNNSGVNSSLALALALRGNENDREEAAGLCKRMLGGMQNEKIMTSTRTLLFLLTKDALNKEETLTQAKQLTHIWESREMITAELYDGKEREEYLKQLIHLIVSLLYSKIQDGRLHDADLLKMIFVGPQNQSATTLQMLDDIKNFIHE